MRPLLLLLLFVSCSHPRVAEDIPIFQNSETGSIDTVNLLITQGNIDKVIALIPPNSRYHTRKLALKILEEGVSKDDAVDNFLSLYGAAYSINDETLPFFEKLISSPYPRMQLVAVLLLSSEHSEIASRLLEKALGSDFLEIRLEALYALCRSHSPNAFEHLDALFQKMPPEGQIVFPELFGLVGSVESKRQLKRMLYDPDVHIRIEAYSALITSFEEERSILCRQEINNVESAIQEIAIHSFCSNRDLSLYDDLENKISKKEPSQATPAELLAAFAVENKEFLIESAKSKNLFAISLLGGSEDFKKTLLELLNSPDDVVRLNAAIQLIKLKDPHALPVIFPLYTFKSDLLVEKMTSPGKTVCYYTLLGGSVKEETAERKESSERIKDELLVLASELPEEPFLHFAEEVFATHRKGAIPLLCHILENIGSKNALELLRRESEHVGCPFIRTYSKLMVYRSQQDAQLEEDLCSWMLAHKDHALIEIRPALFWAHTKLNSQYSLTFEETSQLFCDIVTTLVETKSDKAAELILKLIQSGNPHNRYLLAGMLLRASN